MIADDILSVPVKEAIARAVHQVVCLVTRSDGAFACKYYSAIGSNVLSAVTGRPYKAVGGRSWVTPEAQVGLAVTQAGGQPLLGDGTVPPQLAGIRPPDGLFRHAWIERDSYGLEIVDLSTRPALWSKDSLPAGHERVREARFDDLMADLQDAFKLSASHALFLALPTIVVDLSFEDLKRLLERLSPFGSRLTSRAIIYWRSAQPR